MVEPDRPNTNIIGQMYIACRVTKTTDTHTHTGYVVRIAFPQQQWLHERTSVYGNSTLPVWLLFAFIYTVS